MQIGVESIENLLPWLWCWLKTLERQNQKDTFSFLFAWESAKQIPVWNYPKNNLRNFKLRYAN
jgi:hypothetical protein